VIIKFGMLRRSTEMKCQNVQNAGSDLAPARSAPLVKVAI
jgi:hypothetical protein